MGCLELDHHADRRNVESIARVFALALLFIVLMSTAAVLCAPAAPTGDEVAAKVTEKLKEIPQMIQAIVEEAEDASFSRAHFASFGAYSLNFEVVYYVTRPDMLLYMDIQEIINLEILERFSQESIEFAYPTRTIQIQNS